MAPHIIWLPSPMRVHRPGLIATFAQDTITQVISLERVERRTIQPLGKLMSVIAKAIADRQSEIERLQAEIKALNDVDKMLGTSAPAKPAARRSSSRRPAAAATPVAETASDAKPTRKRRPMTAEEKKAVSERMTASWAERRKKAAK